MFKKDLQKNCNHWLSCWPLGPPLCASNWHPRTTDFQLPRTKLPRGHNSKINEPPQPQIIGYKSCLSYLCFSEKKYRKGNRVYQILFYPSICIHIYLLSSSLSNYSSPTSFCFIFITLYFHRPCPPVILLLGHFLSKRHNICSQDQNGVSFFKF